MLPLFSWASFSGWPEDETPKLLTLALAPGLAGTGIHLHCVGCPLTWARDPRGPARTGQSRPRRDPLAQKHLQARGHSYGGGGHQCLGLCGQLGRQGGLTQPKKDEPKKLPSRSGGPESKPGHPPQDKAGSHADGDPKGQPSGEGTPQRQALSPVPSC